MKIYNLKEKHKYIDELNELEKKDRNKNEINVKTPAIISGIGFVLGLTTLLIVPTIGGILLLGSMGYIGFNLFRISRFCKPNRRVKKLHKALSRVEENGFDKKDDKKESKFKKIFKVFDRKNKKDEKVENNMADNNQGQTKNKTKQIEELKNLKEKLQSNKTKSEGEYSLKRNEIIQDKVNINEICDYYNWNNTNPSYEKSKTKTLNKKVA